MKTKQLLEVIYKSIALFMIIPKIIYLPVDMYNGLVSFHQFSYENDSPYRTEIVFVALLIVYIVFAYYLLIRTDVVVRWVYKEKENEQPINLKWHSRDIIYMMVVIISLYSLFDLTPVYFVNLIKSLDFSETQQSIYNSFKPFDSYFYYDTVQIIISIVILFNASRITAWIDIKRKKKKLNNKKVSV